MVKFDAIYAGGMALQWTVVKLTNAAFTYGYLSPIYFKYHVKSCNKYKIGLVVGLKGRHTAFVCGHGYETNLAAAVLSWYSKSRYIPAIQTNHASCVVDVS